MKLIMPGICDIKLNGRWRGEIIDLKRPKKHRRVCLIYAEKLKDMREIKHAIVELLRKG